jgi:DNA polymerase-3 subunit gamma/tau
MVLVRVAYAADLPTLDDALRQLSNLRSGADAGAPPPSHPSGGGSRSAMAVGGDVASVSVAASPIAPQAPEMRLASFEDVVALAAKHRDIQLKLALEQDVRIVRFEQGSIEFSQSSRASPQLAQALTRRLQEWTGTRWVVAVSNEAGAPSLKERRDAEAAAAMQGVRALPLVSKVLEHFPGAEIVAVRSGEDAAAVDAGAEGAGDDEVSYADQISGEDDL